MTLSQRIKNSVLHRLQAVIDNAYCVRHPGLVARRLIRLAAPFVRLLQPNDRWNLPALIPYWLKTLEQAPQLPVPVSKRIFLFTAFRGTFDQHLVLATLLAWRGHHIVIGYLPLLQSPIKEPRVDHCSVDEYLAEALASVETLSGGRIRCVDLNSEADVAFPVDESYLRLRAHFDTIMTLRRETLDEAEEDVQVEMDYWNRRGREAQHAVGGYLSRHRNEFDLCIIPNGSMFSTAHALKVCQVLGIPVNSFEKFSIRSSRLITHGSQAMDLRDLDLIWRQRQELGLNESGFREAAAAKAMSMVDQRRTGVSDVWVTKIHDPMNTGKRPVRELIGIGENEPIVLVATNVPFDAGYDVLTTVFPSMSTWLRDTLIHLLEHGTKRIILRSHPDEMRWGPKEKVEDILEAAQIDTSRLVFIPGSHKINTYDLMQEADCGVVFSTTVGLEMAMMGKPVLLGAPVYYGGKGFTVDSESREDYLEKLTLFGTDCSTFALRNEQVVDARLYHFLLHFAGQWPYPYDKPSAMVRMPPQELVRHPDVSRYLPFLDAMALSQDEWPSQVGRFINTNATSHMMWPLRDA